MTLIEIDQTTVEWIAVCIGFMMAAIAMVVGTVVVYLPMLWEDGTPRAIFNHGGRKTSSTYVTLGALAFATSLFLVFANFQSLASYSTGISGVETLVIPGLPISYNIVIIGIYVYMVFGDKAIQTYLAVRGHIPARIRLTVIAVIAIAGFGLANSSEAKGYWLLFVWGIPVMMVLPFLTFFQSNVRFWSIGGIPAVLLILFHQLTFLTLWAMFALVADYANIISQSFLIIWLSCIGGVHALFLSGAFAFTYGVREYRGATEEFPADFMGDEAELLLDAARFMASFKKKRDALPMTLKDTAVSAATPTEGKLPTLSALTKRLKR